jgi:hypothetical protein
VGASRGGVKKIFANDAGGRVSMSRGNLWPGAKLLWKCAVWVRYPFIYFAETHERFLLVVTPLCGHRPRALTADERR